MTARPTTRPTPRRALDRGLAGTAPLALAALGALVFVLLGVHPVDQASAQFRADVFADHGLTIWNGQWYGGHYTLSYSVVYPPLASWVGTVPLGIAAALASALLFNAIAREHFGEPSWPGAVWFGIATTTLLLSGRLVFALGVAIGLAAVRAFQLGRSWLAAVLAVGCSLASPVAGLFLALSGFAAAAAGTRRALGLAAAAFAPLALLEVAFAERGRQVFQTKELVMLLITVAIALLVIPRSRSTVRLGLVLYGLLSIAAFAVHSPLGNNVTRLGTLFAGPVAACALATRRSVDRRLLAAAIPLLAVVAYLQWKPAVEDVSKVYREPSAEASYYRPLVGFLGRAGGAPGRVEVPFTRTHWEAAYVGRRFPLARGWQRQLDVVRNRIFYDRPLTPSTYAAWLREHGVRFVAVPDAKLDSASKSERERTLVDRGLPYLRPAWRSPHWRVYAVTIPDPMIVPHADARMTLTRLGVDYVLLQVRRVGEATVRVTWSPYWRAAGACVERSGDWTRVLARRPGALRLTMDFALGRVVSHGRRCA